MHLIAKVVPFSLGYLTFQNALCFVASAFCFSGESIENIFFFFLIVEQCLLLPLNSTGLESIPVFFYVLPKKWSHFLAI